MKRIAAILLVFSGWIHDAAGGEIILQYFNTTWAEIARRMPEVAEAGYTALWLPPPGKAYSSGIYSDGYDPYDRFDLGNKDQSGSTQTKFGTMTDLLNLVQVAHRFGLRVYFDNVMAHNGGPWVDGMAPGTLGPTGFVPEDYHLIRTGDTTYKTPPGPGDTEWQILNRTWFGLDIAQESPNDSFGWNEGDDYAKWVGVRHPGRTDYYLDTDLPVATNYSGAAVYTFANKEPYSDTNGNGRFDWTDTNGNGQHDAGEAGEPFTDTGIDPGRSDHRTAAWGYGDGKYNMGNPVAEDVNGLLIRNIRWFEDLTKCDGFRLDAVKHVPAYFFGKLDDPKDDSNGGYLGQAQEQFNISRGFSDWGNHRDTVFNNEQARDDAFMYGEHLGEPRSKSSSIAGGMRIADDDFLNSVKANVGATLAGMDGPYYGVNSPGTTMLYLMSHDNNCLWSGDREQAHAILLTREGTPIVYTDGYNESGAPGWFPKPSQIPFLGQFASPYVTDLVDINRHFGWGYQASRWNDWDFTSYARYDPNVGLNGAGITMLFMMAKNYLGYWPHRDVDAVFPEGARLVNYSYHGGEFEVVVQGGKLRYPDGNKIYVPPGEYYAFSWRTPQTPLVWDDGLLGEVQPIQILQNGQRVGTVQTVRTDGRNGDAAFNPYGLPDTNTADSTYTLPVPRVTSASNLTFLARADGSAENILMKLDGGIDLNSQMEHVTQAAGTRDYPPALSHDKFLGYEQMRYVRRVAEKFAARDVSRNVIGSYGSETYGATIGSNGFVVADGGGTNTAAGTVTWIYHDPANTHHDGSTKQFNPAPESAAGQPIEIWIKIGYAGQADKAWLYYTTDGTNPEGSGGTGKGSTRTVEMHWVTNGVADGGGLPDWWLGTLPALTTGTELRYKVAAYDDNAPSRFPWSTDDLALKRRMETVFAITNFNAGTVPYYPNNDWGEMATGLKEGFHFLQTKALLGRGSGDTPIYRQFVQTFYYDTQRPGGFVLWPGQDGDSLWDSTYTAILRSDMTVNEVWFRVDDGDSNNDDSQTGTLNGNNAWKRTTRWSVPAPTSQGELQQEWKADYVNIPASGTATLRFRMMEASSSNDMSLSDEAGHFTTVTRTAIAASSGKHFFVATPSEDGATVTNGDRLAVRFSKDLVDGLDDAQVLACFQFQVDGAAHTSGAQQLTRNVTDEDHQVSVTLPNLYDGQPATRHTLRADFSRSGYTNLFAQRWAYAAVNDDSNGDGIPDSWEQQWGVPVGSIHPDDDDDHDGYSNLQEYIANTSPFDDADITFIDGTTPDTNGLLRLTFDARSNRYYHVWSAGTLIASPVTWTRLTTDISPIRGEGHTVTYDLSIQNSTSLYYRLGVVLP